MAKAHCSICISDYSIEDFLFIPCGHCCCKTCMAGLMNQREPSCHLCRKPFRGGDETRVRMTIIDHKTSMAETVAEGLRRMNKDTKLISVERAGEKLKQVAKDVPLEHDMLVLQKAVDDFRERIIPLFSTVQSQCKQIDELTAELKASHRENDDLKTKMRRIKHLEAESQELRLKLRGAERDGQNAILLAEKATDEVIQLRESNAKFGKTAAELEDNNKQLRALLDRHTNDARLKKEKIKVLKRKVEDLSTQLHAHSMEESLRVAEDDEFPTQDFPDIGPFTYEENQDAGETPMSRRSRPAPSSPNLLLNRHSPQREFEGLPHPGFASEWQLGGPTAKRRKVGSADETIRRIVNAHFPIDLDRKGRPLGAVQLGPRRRVHVK